MPPTLPFSTSSKFHGRSNHIRAHFKCIIHLFLSVFLFSVSLFILHCTVFSSVWFWPSFRIVKLFPKVWNHFFDFKTFDMAASIIFIFIIRVDSSKMFDRIKTKILSLPPFLFLYAAFKMISARFRLWFQFQTGNPLLAQINSIFAAAATLHFGIFCFRIFISLFCYFVICSSFRRHVESALVSNRRRLPSSTSARLA